MDEPLSAKEEGELTQSLDELRALDLRLAVEERSLRKPDAKGRERLACIRRVRREIAVTLALAAGTSVDATHPALGTDAFPSPDVA